MLKVRIFCGDGITSSILTMYLRKEMDQAGIEADVQAFSHVFAPREAPGCDAIILSPHAAHYQKEIESSAEGAPLEVLNMAAYGKYGSKALMSQVMGMIHKS